MVEAANNKVSYQLNKLEENEFSIPKFLYLPPPPQMRTLVVYFCLTHHSSRTFLRRNLTYYINCMLLYKLHVMHIYSL